MNEKLTSCNERFLACTGSVCECLSWANIAVGDWVTARTENWQQSCASDCVNGESSVERTVLAADTRYNLPEVQGLVSSPRQTTANRDFNWNTATSLLWSKPRRYFTTNH